MITVRSTAFPPEPLEGGSAAVDKAPEGDYKTDLVQFVSQELAKSDRPELTSAKNIVAGGKYTVSSKLLRYILVSHRNICIGLCAKSSNRKLVSCQLIPYVILMKDVISALCNKINNVELSPTTNLL